MWDEGWSPREKKMVVGMSVLILTVVGLILWKWQGEESVEESAFPPYPSEAQREPVEKEQDKGKQEDQQEMVVDIKGAVKKPGVYPLPPGSRIQDAVKQAGGPVTEADLDRVNLAQLLSDGMALYIPKKGEEDVPAVSAPGSGGGSGNGMQEGEKVNINTAEAGELEELQGIGPAKAAAIIQYREENGPFQSPEDLLNVPGIGEKTLENLKEQVAW
ncbi:helix-hairpin-helix domain-containing protein [Kroppenstedtia pulmonis]|nr:helix-hairpin-helix domain-containing protein [Kroppenstedtia pulmonis]